MMFVECLLNDATICNWQQQLDYNRLQQLREGEKNDTIYELSMENATAYCAHVLTFLLLH